MEWKSHGRTHELLTASGALAAQVAEPPTAGGAYRVTVRGPGGESRAAFGRPTLAGAKAAAERAYRFFVELAGGDE